MPLKALLSSRENEIAILYAGGDTYNIIAKQLFIAPSTVRSHLAAIYRKLKLSSKLELKARLDGDFALANPMTDETAIISELALRLDDGISREKALSAVLRIISGSDGDLNTVIPAILGYALELCDAEFGIMFKYNKEGRFSANFTKGISQECQDWLDKEGEFTAGPKTALDYLVVHREVVNVVDLQSSEFYTDTPLQHATVVLGGARSFVAIPMLAGDDLVGAFNIYRRQVRPFTEGITRLASMFADQSVIAIKNAQLISALRAATHADDPDAILT